ncbi:MAG: hypothetical protein IJI84_04485 [Clostridia bacterium]|nr:hypothetical protein [Clostridia bacterium]
MAKAIKLQDLKKVLTLATSSTKKLVEAGVNGDKEKFPGLLARYKWSGTRDFNLALIIIALYTYCLKQGGDLKNIAQAAIKKDKSNDEGPKSTLGALRHGNGPKLAEYLNKDFGDETIQTIILQGSTAFDMHEDEYEGILDIDKVFKNGLFKQAKKITKWKTNARDVAYCVELLKGKITKEKEADLEKKLDKAYLGSIDDFFEKEGLKSQIKELDETGDKLLHERAATINELKSQNEKLENQYNQESKKAKVLSDRLAAFRPEKKITPDVLKEARDKLKTAKSLPLKMLKDFTNSPQQIKLKELQAKFEEFNHPINNIQFNSQFLAQLSKYVKQFKDSNYDLATLSSNILNKIVAIEKGKNNKEADIYQIKSRPIPQKLYDYLIQKGYKVSKPQTNQDFTYPAICHNDVLDFLKLKNYSVIVKE